MKITKIISVMIMTELFVVKEKNIIQFKQVKFSITDLLGELDIIKKQNNIALNKMNKLNNMNKKFNDDYKILEENFRITLSKI